MTCSALGPSPTMPHDFGAAIFTPPPSAEPMGFKFSSTIPWIAFSRIFEKGKWLHLLDCSCPPFLISLPVLPLVQFRSDNGVLAFPQEAVLWGLFSSLHHLRSLKARIDGPLPMGNIARILCTDLTEIQDSIIDVDPDLHKREHWK